MRPTVFSANRLRQFLRRNRVATLPQLKQLLGTQADITVFRKLKELSYRTSYSHRGSFYTLDEIAVFDERGLWSFSRFGFWYGTLVATAEVCVKQAPAGYFASELEEILHLPVKEPLLQLVEQDRIARQIVSGLYGTVPAMLVPGSSSCRRGNCCRRKPRRPPPASRPIKCRMNFGRRLYCSPACSTNSNGVCTLVWNRCSWVRSPDRRPSPPGPPHGGERATAVDDPRCGGGPRACRRWRAQAGGKKTPVVIDAIHKLMERETAGDPISGLKWTRKTTEKIARQLQRLGIAVSRNTVGRLGPMNYSLRPTARGLLPVLLPTVTASSVLSVGSVISSKSAAIRS